jgi:hypothetical protein
MLLLIALMAMHPVSADSFNPATDRGVFVWGRISLDVRNGLENSGRLRRLRNCSNEQLYCADGDVFNIVLPKRCETIRPDSEWRMGALTTRVLGKRGAWPPAGTSEPPLGSGEYYVHTNERPDLVFLWAPEAGVRAIYYDHQGRVDFAAAARDGTLPRLEKELLSDPLRQHLVMFPLGFDQFAACQPR